MDDGVLRVGSGLAVISAWPYEDQDSRDLKGCITTGGPPGYYMYREIRDSRTLFSTITGVNKLAVAETCTKFSMHKANLVALTRCIVVKDTSNSTFINYLVWDEKSSGPLGNGSWLFR